MTVKNDLPKLAKKLSKAYGCKVRILGPYVWKKTGRKIIDIRGAPESSGLNKTIQLARARLEVLLGRPLRKGETVDHSDNDCTNDSYSNVQLLSHKANAAKQTKASRRKSAKACRTKEARRKNSLRNTGELNPKSKASNQQVKRWRKQFDTERDLDSLLEETPFGTKSLLCCLTGKTYRTAGGPLFTFRRRGAGRCKKPLVVVSVHR